MTAEQTAAVLAIAVGVAFVCIMVLLHRYQHNQEPPAVGARVRWRPPEHSWEWADEAVARYAEAHEMYAIAVGQLHGQGDPALYDQYLRAAQVQWGAVGAANGIGRSKAEEEARHGSQ